MENNEDLLINKTYNETLETDSIIILDSLHVLIPFTLIYGIILATGFFGNLATGVVIAFNKFMHTATNYYLFSLALSDFMLLMCGLPLEMYLMWHPTEYPLNEIQCVLLGLFSESAANATVLTITAFTIERYIAICRPFVSHTHANLSRTVRYIIAIWICAICAAIPEALQFGLDVTEANITICTVKGEGSHQVFVVSFAFFFIIPMSVIAVLYTLIINKLRVSSSFRPSIDSTEGIPLQRYKNNVAQARIIKMLVLVTVCFFFCWAPFHVQRLMAMAAKKMQPTSTKFLTAYVVFTWISGVLYFVSTVVNPIFYSLMSFKFRRAFQITFTCLSGQSRVVRRYSAVQPSRERRISTEPRNRLTRRTTFTTDIINTTPVRKQMENSKIKLREGNSWGDNHPSKRRYIERHAQAPMSGLTAKQLASLDNLTREYPEEVSEHMNRVGMSSSSETEEGDRSICNQESSQNVENNMEMKNHTKNPG